MTQHRFSVGESVELLPSASGNVVPAGVYTVSWCMPVTSMGRQYRVRSTAESHERVLDEAQLRPLRTVDDGPAAR